MSSSNPLGLEVRIIASEGWVPSPRVLSYSVSNPEKLKMANSVRKEIETDKKIKPRQIVAKECLSTGITVLNLALTNTTTGGIPQGTIVHLVGDSDSGKTVLALTAFAEASLNVIFKNHDLVFWNAEDGALMDFAQFYGKKAAARLDVRKPESLEDFYYNVDDQLKSGKPFIGVLDSMDALYPKAWAKKFAKQKAAAKKSEEAAGDYGMAKAKINSENLRRLRTALPKNGSILIIISQTRDNPNATYGDKRAVSGGRTLKFYASVQIWTSTRETLYKTVLSKPRAYGIKMQIDVKKNHITGQKSRTFASITNDQGLDDVGSNIDYLTLEGYWKTSSKDETKGKIVAPEFAKESISRQKLIRLIESSDRERELRQLVRKVWIEIQEGLKTERKKRYE